MGSNDDLARGMSTFMVELWNAGFILKKIQEGEEEEEEEEEAEFGDS